MGIGVNPHSLNFMRIDEMPTEMVAQKDQALNGFILPRLQHNH